MVWPEMTMALLAAERQVEARVHTRAARLHTARRLDERAARATSRARLARLAIQ